MEIKAQLYKPYTEQQRLDFIVEYNHTMGYTIEEADNALIAWGYDDEEKLEQARERKYKENETIREAYLVSGVVYENILWDSDLEQKLNISVQLSTMNEEDTIVWVAMDGVTAMECTKQDLINIGTLLSTMTAYVWQYKNPEIKQAIADAQTIEELNEIEIVYDMSEVLEKEEENEMPTDTADNAEE